METKRTTTKSRHLSTYEYYEIVQIEYICAILRAKIYPKPQDKEYWNKVATSKKVVIENISERNRQLPSIFTDSDLESALQRRVYRENTYPIFVYKNEEQKLNQEYLDLCYYYGKGSDVRFLDEDSGEYVVGKVKEYKPFSSTLIVIYNEKEVKTKVETTRRIL